MARAVTEPAVLVGRGGELAELVSVLDAARPGAVLLGGDAGIGKTRLLEALAEVARADGWRVVAGHGVDLGESALPYLPFSEVIDRIADELPDVVTEVTTTHPALTRLRSGSRMLSGPQRADPAEAGGGPDRLDRGALFDAVRQVLEGAASTAPLLVVVEDLHWADQSTRDLLGFLLSRPLRAPVALVVSYRSDDLHRRHPLRPQLAEWARLRAVHRLQLEPLAPQHVHTLIDHLHPAPLPDGQAADIVDRAEGNAFFVEELVGAMAEPGRLLPADLAELLLIRFDRLDDAARQVVRVASVAGRRVTHSLLAAVSGIRTTQLDDALRQAVEMNVLRTDGQYYAFRHALLAEAAYDDLLPGERVALHSRYVEALRQRTAAGTAAELAHHARRAMDAPTALSAAIEAAREAMAVGGPSEAIRHYDSALDLLAERGRAESTDVDVSVVVAEAAEALVAGGHVVRAAALVAEQLSRLPPDAPPAWRARMLSARAEALSGIESHEEPVVVSAEAVRLLAGADGPLRARVLSLHARILSQDGRSEEARTVGLEAMALAERLGLPLVASDALTTVSRIGADASELDRRVALADAVQQARRAGNAAAELRGQFWLGLSHLGSGELEAAEESLRKGMELGDGLGTPFAPYSLESRWHLAEVLTTVGRWSEALDVLRVLDDGPPPIPAALLEVQRLKILMARGEGGSDRLPAMRSLWPIDGMLAVQSAGLEIEAATDAGRLVDALECYDRVVEVVGRAWTPWFEARLRLAATALTAVAALVDAVPAAERPTVTAQAARLFADGRAVLDRVAVRGAETAAWAELLTAEWCRVRWTVGADPPSAAELVSSWRAAVEGFERYGHVHLAARARTVLAEILTATGDLDGARTQAELAREVAGRLGVEPLIGRLDRAGGPAQLPTTPTSVPALTLTHREGEVLTLVAQGRSNGEIGKRLFISTKTVSVHVSNILAKLGASGRTEAAAIARRKGLIE